MTELLRVEEVVKAFGPSRVLRGVTFAVGQGEVVGLFGPNGSGKTTLANVISGLVHPDRGRILFEGRDITRLPMDARYRAGIARTFQIPDPYPSLTVAEAVRVAMLCGRGDGPDGQKAGGALEEVLRRTGLAAQRFWPASKLSQGCLRRLEFARAIACRPRLVVLDEVFSALSAKDEEDLAALMRALHRDEGVAFLLISHNPLLLEELCGRVVALEEGRVAWQGPSRDLGKYVPAAEAHHHGGEHP